MKFGLAFLACAAAQSDIRWFSDVGCTQLATGIPGGVAEFTNMAAGECTEQFGTALDGVVPDWEGNPSWGGYKVASSFLYLCGGVRRLDSNFRGRRVACCFLTPAWFRDSPPDHRGSV